MKQRVVLFFGLAILLSAGWQGCQRLQVWRALQREDLSAAQVAALAQSQSSAVLWERAGWLAWRAEQPDQARAYLLRARAGGTLSPQGYGLLGDLYANDGQLDTAVNFWQQAIAEGAPQTSVWHIRLAQVAESRQAWQSAIEHYRAALAEEPANEQIVYRLGLLLSIFEPNAAQAYLSRLAKGDPLHAQAAEELRQDLLLGSLQDSPAYTLTLVGRTLAKQEEWALAVTALQRATTIAPQYAEAWAFLGQALESSGQDGGEALETALHINPDSLSANILSALYWRKHNQPERALVYAYRGAENDPQNPLWQMEIGLTLGQMGNLPAAAKHYRQATTLNPDAPQTWRALATFCINYNYDLQATGLPAARQAVLLAFDDPLSLETLGRVYLRLGNLLLARRFAQQALQQDPGLVSAYLDLGTVAALQGDMTQAQRMFETVLTLAPNSPEAEQVRRLLSQQ